MTKFIIDNIAIIATLGFIAGFAWIFYDTYKRKNKKKLEDHANIPFKDED